MYVTLETRGRKGSYSANGAYGNPSVISRAPPKSPTALDTSGCGEESEIRILGKISPTGRLRVEDCVVEAEKRFGGMYVSDFRFVDADVDADVDAAGRCRYHAMLGHVGVVGDAERREAK